MAPQALLLLMVAGLAIGCGSRVEVQGEPAGETSGTGDASDCVACTQFGINQHNFNDRPFCEGEEEKYQALLECACQEDTCLRDGCSEAPSPVASGLCDGVKIDGACQKCLRESCAETYRACGDPG